MMQRLNTSIKSFSFFLIGFLLATLSAANAHADSVGAPSSITALILGDWYGEDSDLDNIRTDLIGSDTRFDQSGSASLNLTHGLPSLSYLQQFDSVLVFSDSVSVDYTELSDLLGNYVNAGGGVVLSTFWGQQAGSVGGIINSTGYNPLINPQSDAYRSVSLGAYIATDPLMQGVTNIIGTTFLGDYIPGLDAGATLAASWDDGNPLAAYNASGNVAAITLYPNVAFFGNASGEYDRLFANALAMTGGYGETTTVPEASTLTFCATGLVVLLARVRKKARQLV